MSNLQVRCSFNSFLRPGVYFSCTNQQDCLWQQNHLLWNVYAFLKSQCHIIFWYHEILNLGSKFYAIFWTRLNISLWNIEHPPPPMKYWTLGSKYYCYEILNPLLFSFAAIGEGFKINILLWNVEASLIFFCRGGLKY